MSNRIEVALCTACLIFALCNKSFLAEEVKLASQKLLLAPASYDFGKVKQFQVLKHDFLIKNNGAKVLSVRVVDIPQDCAAWISLGNEIPPGKNAKLNIRWVIGNALGPLQKTITLKTTEESASRQVKFTLSAVVEQYDYAGGQSASHQSQLQGNETTLATADSPIIHFQKTIHDFGKRYSGEQLTHIFKFSNEGKLDLMIKQVKTTCRCTASALSNKKIAGGAEGGIKISYNTRGTTGQISKSIYVHSNDPRHPVTKLVIKANLKVAYDLLPEVVNFGNVKRGLSPVKSLIVMNRSNRILEIKSVICNSSNVKVISRKQVNGALCAYKIELGLSPSVPVGILREKLIIQTNLQRAGTIEVPLIANIIGDVDVIPKIISYGLVETGKTVSRKIHLHSSRKNLKILGVQSTGKCLSFKVDQPSVDGELVIKVLLAVPKQHGMLKEDINIRTDSKDMPLIKVPIYAYVKD